MMIVLKEAPPPTTAQSGVFGSLTKGIVDSSKNVVKAVQIKAHHIVS
jgi:phosphatidylinositol-3,4,5-trisphosphate 3-phosphatase and dual-specificity protein phosphatase PTEN